MTSTAANENQRPNSSQRWRERRSRFVGATEYIRPDEYHVEVLDGDKLARQFIEQHHYARSLPATRLNCGLYRNAPTGSRLVGVACFSVPMNNQAITRHTGLEFARQGCDLGRLVLLDEVPSNGESWFLSRAMKLLQTAKPEIEAVIAYSDPVVRRTAGGNTILPGHVGEIYQALGAICRGRGTRRTLRLLPDATVISDRTLSKIRNGETGQEYGMRQIIDQGAEAPKAGEHPAQWIERLDRTGFFQRIAHPGNWVYSFPLSNKAKELGRPIDAYHYPKRDRTVINGDVSRLPLAA